jgi:hypothetical protein
LLRDKLDDIANNAAEAEPQAIELGTKKVAAQFQAAIAITIL